MNKPTPTERYQFKPFFGSSHTWALERCKMLANTTRILDVGVGNGSVAAALKGQGLSNIWGIEDDPGAAEVARPIYKNIVSRIDQLDEQRFDVILLLDVLEHMTTPFEFLKQVSTYLEPAGQILISVPNVAHWSLRLSLLFGYWVYTTRGLLDETHFHLFTRQHLEELISSVTDLELQEMDSSISPAELVLPCWVTNSSFFKFTSKVRYSATKLLPGLAAYQHLAVVRKIR